MSRSTRRESHVLKLVHPGGFIELHTNPIMASEIMKKNPRHCVTRPDIFKFPWNVISPESILTPGNVFFLVPCHTIRHLLKSTDSNTNTLIKHLRDRFLRRHTNTNDQFFIDQQVQQDHHRHRYPNKIKSLKKQSFNGGNKDLSFVTERLVYHSISREYTSFDARIVKPGISTTNDSVQIINPVLKSCLKKGKKQGARLSNLRVRFDFTATRISVF